LGIAGAEDYCVIFKGGQIIRRVDAAEAESQFFKEIEKLINE